MCSEREFCRGECGRPGQSIYARADRSKLPRSCTPCSTAGQYLRPALTLTLPSYEPLKRRPPLMASARTASVWPVSVFSRCSVSRLHTWRSTGAGSETILQQQKQDQKFSLQGSLLLWQDVISSKTS